ncbi:MAG: FoF1 ATP synthase subunit a [Candidatus Faecousia sp.]|nr:F0F1 ATP synthase subunit A [Clostridiales bacterium]MCI6937661.1 F0F1 ATP synthase subunit A [Clostridiales bacterium]MDD5883970.1 F0F1 ATP synthase subunit A [Bacillota bacterium]MDY4598729.1 FoF1 ATP synthase subunit a [Candidatus Faecousia sp.]
MEVSINGAKILATFENVPIFGTVQITQTLVVSWLIMLIISALCIWLGSNLKVTGISRKQAVAEMIYNALVNFVRGNMGPEFDRYIPLVGAIFVTSVVSNLISLLGIWSPTADLMTELAWALVVFVLITYHKIKASGIGGYLKGFLEPIFVLAPINIMSELFTPVSMACRHFGNILSGTVIGALIYAALTTASHALFHLLGSSLAVALIVTLAGAALLFLGKKAKKKFFFILGIIIAVLGVLAVLTNLGAAYPWLTIGIPAIPSLYFDWFGGCIQAFIFCTLTTLFIKQAAGD